MATLTERHPLPRVHVSWLHLPILDRYLLAEMSGPFLFAFSGYLLFWALNIFFIASDYLINQHAPFFLVLRFVIFRIPQSIPMAFPFACLFSALLAMGRVMGDNEVTAMRTAGIPILRIALAPMIFGVLMFAVTYATNEYISPISVDLSTRSFYQILYKTDSLPVEPQFFRKDPDTGNVFFVTSVAADNKTMQGVQIFKPAHFGPWTETIQAKDATVDQTVLVLHHVIDTRYNSDGFMTSQQQIKQMRVGLPLGETVSQFTSSINNDPWTMSSKTLKNQVKVLQMQGVGGSALGGLEVNLANRLAYPFACIIGVLISVPLAIRFGRRGRALSMALAILTFFAYYLLQTAAAAFGRNGAINPYLAAWIPNIIFGFAGALLLWLEDR